MFNIDKDTVLDDILLHKMMNRFQTSELLKMQKWGNYYNGIHEICNKIHSNKKEYYSVVTNMCKTIVDTFAGYICGKPISYTSDSDIKDIQQVINYNDSTQEDIEWCTNALIYGVGYELQWLDEFAQIRYSQINPMNAFPVYTNTLDSELLYFVRWYKENSLSDNDTYIIEVYDAKTVKVYRSHGVAGAYEFIDERQHYFGDVPVSVFWLNSQEKNIFDPIITLQDAYNDLQSGEIESFNAWVDSYLVLTNCDAEAEDVAKMKEDRTILLPQGSTAEFLTKNVSDTQIQNMLENIKKNIYKIVSCPDMSDETFLAQSGEAIKWKLLGFENISAGIVARMTKAVQKRIELICNILNLKASDAIWRDIDIQFTRNLPTNNTEVVQLVQGLQNIVSNETLLSLLPFIKDSKMEQEKLQKQKEQNKELYSFNMGAEDDEE